MRGAPATMPLPAFPRKLLAFPSLVNIDDRLSVFPKPEKSKQKTKNMRYKKPASNAQKEAGFKSG